MEDSNNGTTEAIFEARKGRATGLGRSWFDLFDGRRRGGSSFAGERRNSIDELFTQSTDHARRRRNR